MDTSTTDYAPSKEEGSSMVTPQPIQIKVSPDDKRTRPRVRRSSSAPPVNMVEDEEDKGGNLSTGEDLNLPRSKSSLSVRFSPEPPEVYEYPPATVDPKPEKTNNGNPILALPWHPTS